MSTANKIYVSQYRIWRRTNKKQQGIWVNKHKDDEEYRNHTNMKQRERYQKRKMAKELLKKTYV